MKLISKFLFLLLIFNGINFCSRAQNILPVDKKATKETRNLYTNLWNLLNKGIMFGHQDDLAYGVGWEYEPGRSDVKSVCGAYPAVYGWELGRLESDSSKNLDGVPFKNMEAYVKEVYNRGGINTFSWHFNDPVTGETAWSKPQGTVKAIIPGGEHHEAYKKYLDKFAAFIMRLKGPDGEMIPILFRPLHEHTGSWFWWGKDFCTPDEYIALWRFTVNYLQNEKKLHNLLFVYSAADYATEQEYLERYPGDDYVDLMGFDAYYKEGENYFIKDLQNRLKILETVAAKHHKIPTLSETGYNQIPDSTWWTNILLKTVAPYKISYALVWRNWKQEHFFAPYPGQISADNFREFYNDQRTIFQDGLSAAIYKNP